MAATEVGKHIRELRDTRNWSQRDLATRTGFSRETIASVECGQLRPSLRLLKRIEEACSAEPGALVKMALTEYFEAFCKRNEVDSDEMLGFLNEALKSDESRPDRPAKSSADPPTERPARDRHDGLRRRERVAVIQKLQKALKPLAQLEPELERLIRGSMAGVGWGSLSDFARNWSPSGFFICPWSSVSTT